MKISFLSLVSRKSVALVASFVSAIILALLATWFVRRPLAQPVPPDDELDAAILATMEIVIRDKPALANDLTRLQEAVTVVFPMIYPELALRERRKDPEFAAVEWAGLSEFLNARAIQAQQMKDPQFLRQRQEAERALSAGVNATAEEIFRAWKKRVLGDGGQPAEPTARN